MTTCALEFKTPIFSNGHVYEEYHIALNNQGLIVISNSGSSSSIIESNGYKYCNLHNNKTGKVDRLPMGPLILSTFKSLPPDYTIDYIDGNSLNTSLDNLRWAPSIKTDYHSSTRISISAISLRTRPLLNSSGKQYSNYTINLLKSGNCLIYNLENKQNVNFFTENNQVFVNLGDNNEKVLVAELFLSSFVCKKPEYVCEHINQNVSDNRISNLKWITQKSKAEKKINSVFISDKLDFSFVEDELWKEIENTGFFLSTHGREAFKTKDDLFYLRKQRKPRVNGNVRFRHPFTMKLIDLHVAVFDLFSTRKSSESDNFVVVRKPTSTSGSNCLKDLQLIDSSIPILYTYGKNLCKTYHVSERNLLSLIKMRKKDFKLMNENQLKSLDIAIENSNVIESDVVSEGCFKINNIDEFGKLFKNIKISDNEPKNSLEEEEEEEEEEEDEEEEVESSDIEEEIINYNNKKQKVIEYDEVIDLTNEKFKQEDYNNRFIDFLKSKKKYKKSKANFRKYLETKDFKSKSYDYFNIRKQFKKNEIEFKKFKKLYFDKVEEGKEEGKEEEKALINIVSKNRKRSHSI
jgi:hypothetical protein